ncbi:MAG: IS607 family transposase [Nitrososphaera sp.]|nr:IS607 family transposase [Nitrososphaera sp.]
MKLSDWAKIHGISYTTAYRWFKAGKLPVKSMQTESGTILVEENVSSKDTKETWIYCRVSSYGQKDNLARQVERCQEFCRVNGWEVEKVVKEIASGMNDKRPKLLKLLESKPTRIVVEYKDRLTRFGFGYFESLLPKIGCELVVINKDVEDKQDLMKDLVSIITSFCCRLYGLRRGKVRAKKLHEELNAEAT